MIHALMQAALLVDGCFEFSLLIRVTVLSALGLGAVTLTRRSRAAVCHFILAATLVAGGLLPLLLVFDVYVPITILPPRDFSPASNAMVSLGTDSLSVATNTGPIPPISRKLTPLRQALRILDFIWFAGIMVFVVRLVSSSWRLRRFRREGLPWLERQEHMQAIATRVGVKARVELLMHEGITAPLTCGFRRPVILCPVKARNWSDDELRRVLVHELEHVRRDDWTIDFVARIICAIYWFHPMIWTACRKLRLEAERACDDAAIEKADCVERAEYAAQLVSIARRLSMTPAEGALGLAHRSDLSLRVSALLDGTQRRGRMNLQMTATVLVGVTLFTLAVAGVQIVAQVPSASESKSASGLRIYPGARPKPEHVASQQHRGTLILDRVRVEEASAGKYEAASASSEVVAFYRASLQQFGNVTECNGGTNRAVSVRISPESLHDMSICRPGDFGEGETELKSGSRADYWIVTVQPSGPGSEFSLVHIHNAKSALRSMEN